MTSEELWNEFCERTGTDRAQNHEAWAFCGGGAAADELLTLVLDGKKFGTASIYEDYLAERRKGCATWMLKKALEFLKYGLMEDRAEISVLPENEASRRTVLANGGVYRDSVFVERKNATLDRFLINLTER